MALEVRRPDGSVDYFPEPGDRDIPGVGTVWIKQQFEVADDGVLRIIRIPYTRDKLNDQWVLDESSVRTVGVYKSDAWSDIREVPERPA